MEPPGWPTSLELHNMGEAQITIYERNKKDEVISTTSPLGDVVKYSYDKVGNIISKLDEDNLETLYEYNLANKLSKVSYADGKTVEFSYNPLKQLTEMKDWLGTTTIEVDELGRAIKTTDFEGNTVGYAWDAIGQRKKLTYPGGKEVSYTYNASGRLSTVTDKTDITSYSYDPMGRIKERILPDGTATTYSFNALGALASLTHSQGSNILDQFKYSYDLVGNMTEIEKYRVGIETDNGLFKYAYDLLNRLVGVENNQDSRQYTYDSLGNRIASLNNGVETTNQFNVRNQLVKTMEGENQTDYSYDKRGNLIGTIENGQAKASYTFDATNMMVGASTGKGKASYSYDGFKNRVGKLETIGQDTIPDPTKEVRYILDMTLPYDNLLMTQGVEKQSFTWGNSLLTSHSKDDFYYLQDHLGSPVRLLDVKDNQEALAYDEFGVPKLMGNTPSIQGFDNPFGFAGYQIDNISGLQYAQARYYTPTLGRFVARDIISHGLNWYTYCEGNPLRFVDLNGLNPSLFEAALMAEHIYNANLERDRGENLGNNFGGWTLNDIYTNDESLKIGVYSRAVNGVTEYALVNRGTPSPNLGRQHPDIGTAWINNFQQTLGTSQDMTDSIAFARAFVDGRTGNVTMVGHSKGGPEAKANALATGLTAIVFNPAALSANTQRAYSLPGSAYSGGGIFNGLIISAIVRGDALYEARIGSIRLFADDIRAESNSIIYLTNIGSHNPHSIAAVIEALEVFGVLRTLNAVDSC